MTISPIAFRIIDLALEEDLGRGDVTSRLTVDPNSVSSGRVVAKQDLTVSGAEVFSAVMARVDEKTQVNILAEDGRFAPKNSSIIEISGLTRSLLAAERVALNFLQRLSGTASMTKLFVEALPKGAKTIITDTRKTTPGMRYLERQAVLHGGGRNHREDLGSGILIKENHIAATGSIESAVLRAKNGAPHPLKVEVEIRSEQDLEKAINAGADAVLLDNMDLASIMRCVQIAGGRVFLEVSGGVTLKNVAAIAATGVDAISVGGLTHSAPAADISFLLEGA